MRLETTAWLFSSTAGAPSRYHRRHSMSRGSSMKRFALLAAVVLALAVDAFAQSPALQSPEVSSDHRVTFRILAPKASEVTLTGDWLGTTQPPKLTKDDNGVWSVTLGPFEPSIY